MNLRIDMKLILLKIDPKLNVAGNLQENEFLSHRNSENMPPMLIVQCIYPNEIRKEGLDKLH
jgi:hypothetical protein